MDFKILLRHHLATLAMRCGHVLFKTKEDFPEFLSGNDVKTPYDLMYHIANMIVWSNDKLIGQKFTPSDRLEWDELKELFYDALRDIDKTIKTTENIDIQLLLTLYQGPFNDAMTHVGQLFTLRRLHGDPVNPVNYMKVDIIPGKFDYSEYYL